ncbi:MAG: tetratricopeptide repeat protein [Halopseudomonas aestusnigri]
MMRKKLCLLIYLTLLLSACSGNYSGNQQPEHVINARNELAKSLIVGGNFDAAVRLYQDLAKNYPYDPDPVLRLGNLFLEVHDLIGAFAAFEEAYSRGAKQEAMIGHGRIALTRNQAEKAIELFSEVLSKDPQNFDALNGQGVANDIMGNYLVAQNFYAKAQGVNPSSRGLQRNIALSLSFSGETDQSKSIMQHLVSSPGVTEQEHQNLSFISVLGGKTSDVRNLNPDFSIEQHQSFLNYWFNMELSK